MIYHHAKPFTNIAIALSGGGYRAAAFHLGTLSILDYLSLEYSNEENKTLLTRVTSLSTVSGGTITGAMYALMIAQGRSFDDVFKELYILLQEDTLVKEAFDKLNNTTKWVSRNKKRNLINAFAEVYNTNFYKEQTFQSLFDAKDNHLKNITFNATDFKNEFHFRFQTEGIFGNKNIRIPKEVAKDIRIGDAVAASSCFPLGFEPIELPKDFAYEVQGSIVQFWQSKGWSKVALMDGGVVDNQGLNSVLKTEDRKEKREDDKTIPYTGTFIISDVNKAGEGYTPFQYSYKRNLPSIRVFNWIIVLVFLFSTAGIISFFIGFLGLWSLVLGVVLCTLCILYLGIYLWIWKGVIRLARNTLGRAELEGINNLKLLKKTPLNIILNLAKDRVYSSFSMINSIFMTRIRSLRFETLYEQSKWRYRLISNNIGDLKKSKNLYGDELQQIIDDAYLMGTTLWFSPDEKKNNRLDHLIISGQITICHNLLNYFEKPEFKGIMNQLSESDKKALLLLKLAIKSLIQVLKDKPFFLIQKYTLKEES